MRITSVSIKNFMNIKRADLLFSDGINVLYGSNGNGKSAVFEVIDFLLTEHKKGDSWKDYIKSGENYFDIGMTLQMSDPSDTMVISCKGESSKGSINKLVEYGDKKYLNSDASAFLSRTFDQDMLNNTSFLMQDGEPINKMKPSVRRDIFKKIFNSDFPFIVEKIGEDKKPIEKKIIELKAKIELLQKKEYKLYKIIEIDNSELDTLKKEMEESQATELEKQKYKHFSDKLEELNNKQEELSTLTNSKSSYLSKINNFKKEIDQYSKEVEELQNKQSLLEKEVAESKRKLDEKECEKKNHDNDLHKIKDLESEIEVIRDAISSLIGTKSLLDSQKKLRMKGLCEHCGSKFESKDVEDIRNQITTVEKDINSKKTDKDEKEKIVKNYNERKDSLNSDITRLSQIFNKNLSNRDIDKNKISLIESKIKTIRDSMIPREQTLIVEIDKSIALINSKIQELSLWIKENENKNVQSNLRPSSEIQSDINEFLQRIQKNIVEGKMNQNILNEKAKDQEVLSSSVIELNELQIKSKRLDTVKKIYEIDFPSYINLQACDILQEYMNNFFGSTKQNFLIKLEPDTKGINFHYKSDNNPEWINAKMVSGFESALLTVGFKVSVGYAYNSDFIILDEPDKTADDNHSEKLFSTITSIGGFKQIFVITHKSIAMDYLRESGAVIYNVSEGRITRV